MLNWELLSASITLQACDPPQEWFRWQPGTATKNFGWKALSWDNFLCIYKQVIFNPAASYSTTKIFLHLLLSPPPDNAIPSTDETDLTLVSLEAIKSLKHCSPPRLFQQMETFDGPWMMVLFPYLASSSSFREATNCQDTSTSDPGPSREVWMTDYHGPRELQWLQYTTDSSATPEDGNPLSIYKALLNEMGILAN